MSHQYPYLYAGAALLHEELECLGKHADVAEAYVHVHIANSDALDFYARSGFTKDPQPLVGYYSHNREVPEPKDAFVLRKANDKYKK